MSIGIVIATYGDDKWKKLAERAYQTVVSQTVKADQIEVYHGSSLSEARNTAISRLGTTDCVILDADDGLDKNYVRDMLYSKGDLRFPRLQRIYPDNRRELITYKKVNLLDANYCVIGTMFPKALFERVGGFRDEPIFEDWSLWIRMWRLGAEIEPSQAVYTATYSPEGRNRGDGVDVEYWYNKIRGY